MPTLSESTKQEQSAWLEIDIDRLHQNLKTLEDHVGFDTKTLAVVKANAYGHGLVGIGQALESRVSYLGVSSIQEALELKESGIETPIFMFGQLIPSELPNAIVPGITLSISSFEQAEEISRLSKERDLQTPVHIKVDTGMGRLGIPFRKAVEQIEKIAELSNLNLEGIYTHFPTAEKNDGFAQKQLSDFCLLIQALEQKDIRFVFRHASNSSACVKMREGMLNLMRPGLMLYGLYPDISLRDHAEVKPTLSLKSRVIMVKRLVPGESVGYGRDFIAEKPTTIATIPIGYSHGYPFKASAKAEVLINGKRYPLAGRISMDYICVNLGDDYAEPGYEVTLIGEEKENKVTVEELANWAETIPYEIVTGLTSRLPRFYKGKNE